MPRLFAAFLIFALVACAGPVVKRDYDASADFGSLKTFIWKSEGFGSWESPLMEKRVRSAAESVLAEKGYRKAEGTPPDFWVTGHYIIEREERDRVRTGVGIGAGTGGLFGGVSVGVGVGDRKREIETLGIDVLDPSTGDLLWRGTAHPDFSGLRPEKAQEKVDKTVQAILRKFPPE
jgi:hypothetical protein